MTILENLQNYIKDDNNRYYGYEISSHDAKEIVKALEFQQGVVRCKDCIHYSNPEIGWCDIHSHMTSTSLDDWTTFDDDSFCSDGERREEE